jgi:hypothetical protein
MNGKIIFLVPADLPKAQQHPVSSGAVPHYFAIHDFAEISIPHKTCRKNTKMTDSSTEAQRVV